MCIGNISLRRGNGTIVAFPAAADAAIATAPASPPAMEPRVSAPTLEPGVVATGFGHPTSARWGMGPGLDGSLFVTQGDGLWPAQHNDRVYRVDFV